MKSVIESRARVDARGALVFRDPRLVPGEEVEIIVRPLTEPTAVVSFLQAARRVRIDAPGDFSERFDEPMKLKP